MGENDSAEKSEAEASSEALFRSSSEAVPDSKFMWIRERIEREESYDEIVIDLYWFYIWKCTKEVAYIQYLAKLLEAQAM